MVLGPGLLARPAEGTRTEPQTPDKEKWIATGCNGCVGWCPLRVQVVEGKAVKIAGNPNSRWTRGKLCPRALLNLQVLYDLDRVKVPLKRTNPNKGRAEDPRWVEITWDEAIATIAARLQELRDKGTPERFALFRGRYGAMDADLLYGRFAKADGTPNAISHSALCAETTKSGNWYARGKYTYSAFDFEDTNYILSFGVPFLESHRPTTGMIAAFAEGRRGRAVRPRVVVVDPRYSVATARVSEGIHPAVVAMSYGQGHWAYGKWAKGIGANPNEITGVMYEHITGMAAYFNTRVRISKA